MGRKIRKKRTGGLLIGPSHEDGGIIATTPGMPDVELEGGEYIINAQTVNALGTEFLDKLNSTQTTYHTGGFGAGQLPNPSNYRRGGVIRKKGRGGKVQMRRGGTPRRRMQTGGRNSCGPGMVYQNGGCIPSMRAGGRTKKMPHGGFHTDGRGFGIMPEFEDGFGTEGSAIGRRRYRYRRRVRPPRQGRQMGGKMPHGGLHNGGGPVFCPQGNYGYDEYGNQVCV